MRTDRGGAGAALAREEQACVTEKPAASGVTAHGRRKRADGVSEPTGDGRVGSGGAVFADLNRPVGTLALQE